MLSQNYPVAARTAQQAVVNGHHDVYKSPFSDSGEEGYQWRAGRQSLEQILREEKLPLVVRLGTESVVRQKETPVDLQRPILLFQEVKEKKLHARNIQSRAAARDNRVIYQEVGPDVIIPQTFEGYFRPLDGKDQPLTSTADLARLMPEMFLSCSPCEGYSCLSKIGGNLYQKGVLPCGIYYLKNVLEESITYLNKRKSEKKKLLRCLSCEDEHGKTVLFPMDGNRSFYVAKPGSRFPKVHLDSSSHFRVYRWTDFEAPRLKGFRVKMKHGTPPKEDCHFTGFLEFRHVTEDHNVIGCTMTSSPRLFEMAVTTEPYFNVAMNSGSLDTTDSLQQKCLKYARQESQLYLNTIKVRKDYDIEQPDAEIKE
ncbi:uncharacterized protein LOC106012207 [Aplysia californica]|uniref:Uncharacterized protein LOC106012207 n=1 Tax=Aplysia californica TaxID=6500 RepID=A0ABM1A344_APLCA|nr:uncharacterized protein LOC106012207 [Aplysia californica]